MLKQTLMIGLVLIATCVHGGEGMKSDREATKKRVFDVCDYGAKGDDKTDNTAAFSACLDAVIAAGGGRMAGRPAGL